MKEFYNLDLLFFYIVGNYLHLQTVSNLLTLQIESLHYSIYRWKLVYIIFREPSQVLHNKAIHKQFLIDHFFDKY